MKFGSPGQKNNGVCHRYRSAEGKRELRTVDSGQCADVRASRWLPRYVTWPVGQDSKSKSN